MTKENNKNNDYLNFSSNSLFPAYNASGKSPVGGGSGNNVETGSVYRSGGGGGGGYGKQIFKSGIDYTVDLSLSITVGNGGAYGTFTSVNGPAYGGAGANGKVVIWW